MLEYILIYTLTFISLFINGVIAQPSSQIIYLTAGYTISSYSKLELLSFILFASLGNASGNMLLYYIFYKDKKSYIKKILSLMSIQEEKLMEKLNFLKDNSLFWIIIGKTTPSIKVFVPMIAGLIKINKIKAFVGFFFGSLVFANIFIFIGYYFGDKFDLKTFYFIVLSIYLLIFLFFKYKEKAK